MAATHDDQPHGAHAHGSSSHGSSSHGSTGHGSHDDHGGGHGDSHGADRSGWVLVPLAVGLVLAIVVIVVLGVSSDVPERRTPIGADEADVERRDTGLTGAKNP